jgi:two-component system nitrogen regulation response regulator GlnG
LVLIEPKRLGADVAALRGSFEDTHPGVPVVVIGDAGLESAIAAMRAGAADYIEVTAPASEIVAAARRLVSERAIVSSLAGGSLATERGLDLVGNSSKFRELRERVAQLSQSDVTVLISGETGTGKERLAPRQTCA